MHTSRYAKLFIIFLMIFSFTSINIKRVNAISPSSILVNVNPENINPNDNVTITLSSYLANLDSVLITWLVDGKNTSSGIGKKSFLIKAPSAGSQNTVVAKINLPDGEISKAIIIRPAVMVLLWQANDSYVPPFYRGKALPSMESEVKVVAMPEIKTGNTFADPKNMTYSWRKNYTNMQNDSGYGKNYFLFVGDYLDDTNDISVTASTIDQKYQSGANVTIASYTPKINFYKKSNSLGTIFEKSLNEGYQIDKSEILFAAPYFISPKNIRIPTLTWLWSINDNAINNETSFKNLLPVKVQEGTRGSAKIKLEISDRYKIYQNITKEMNVNF